MLPFVESEHLVAIDVSRLESMLNVDELLLLQVHLGQQAVVALLEEGGEVSIGAALADLALDARVRVVYDGQEHVDQHKEHKENVAYEEDRSESGRSGLQSDEVKVAQDGAEEREHGVRDARVVEDLRAEQQVAELNVREEHNEEHDREAHEVLGAAAQGLAQLVHGLVEAHVLEELDPAHEGENGDGVVEAGLAGDQHVELGVLVRVGQERVQDAVDRDGAVDVEAHADDADDENDNVEDVPDVDEVLELVDPDLEDLFDRVVDQEEGEDDLQREHKVVQRGHVADELGRSEQVRGHAAAGGRALQDETNAAEHVYVAVVHGEVEKDSAGASVEPVVVEQGVDQVVVGRVVVNAEVLVVAASAVCADQTRDNRSAQLQRRRISPSLVLL